MAFAALSSIVLSGCLIPQDVDPVSDRAHPPPRILFESIPNEYLVPFLTLPRATRTGCKCTLRLVVPRVAFDDASVTLEARWFVDYQPNSAAVFRQAEFLRGSLDFTQKTRDGPSLDVNADAFSGDGFHAVDVVVAEDGAFKAEGATPSPKPFRTLISTAYESAEYRFFINVKTDPDAVECGPPALFLACGGGG
jgi:hypothetical protein